jgi:aminopeptidase N
MRLWRFPTLYTLTVYEEGPSKCSARSRNLVGAEGFRKGSDSYFVATMAVAADPDDFIRDEVRQWHRPDLFKRWYSQAGIAV